jgi:outer membrane protein assembly factor BamD
MIRRLVLPSVLLLGFVAAGTGCSGSGGLQFPSAEVAYSEGKALYDRGRHMRAIEYFQRVFDFGRGHAYAADAQYYLAQSYFETRQYLLAANEFTRFVEFYRTDPRVEEGEFKRALSYVRLSPPYQLDQTDTQNALNFLRLYLGKYPQGEYADRAVELVDEMRYKLARKQFEIAELYETRSMFHAAAIEYQRVLGDFPDSEFADQAVFGAMRNYKAYAERSVPARRAERYRLATEQFTRLEQLFPRSPVLAEARALNAEIQAELARIEGTAAR